MNHRNHEGTEWAASLRKFYTKAGRPGGKSKLNAQR
jgi:hypothetical protein